MKKLPAPLPGNELLRTDAAPQNPPAEIIDSPNRVGDARERHGEVVAMRFAAAGIAHPGAEIFLRVFKYEGQLELWGREKAAGSAAFRLVATYPIVRASGRLGPKRWEGDRQVPEGFYVIDRFNPRSLFHLSLGLNYPNASDRILAVDREHPGSDVFIHGGSDSIGCLAMGDPAIEEIYVAADNARQAGQTAIPVHIFPCRLNAANWTNLLSPICTGHGLLEGFWQSLQAPYDEFERTHQVPLMRVLDGGSYECLSCPHG